MILVSIIIINYNAGFHLVSCINSIKHQTVETYEIIIIDNCSTDDSLKAIIPSSTTTIIYNSINVGFAKAQNQGISLATGKYILPLNFDILLEPNCIEEMVKAIEQSERIGTVAPKILRMSPNLEKSNNFDNAGLLLPPNRFPYHRGRGEMDTGQYNQSVRVFGAMGAASLYRREMLEDISFEGQYFDETYFMWYEDIDLDWRARLRGWECLYTPQAVAYHVGDVHGHGRSKLGVRISIRNRWRTIFSNECFGCMIRNIRFLIIEEFKLLLHVIKFGLMKEYVWAVMSFFISLPYSIKKRHWVKRQARYHCLPEYPLAFEGLKK